MASTTTSAVTAPPPASHRSTTRPPPSTETRHKEPSTISGEPQIGSVTPLEAAGNSAIRTELRPCRDARRSRRSRAIADDRIVSMESRRFAVVVASAGRGKLLVPVPFTPDEVWGAKQRHHIAGTVNGIGVRAVIEPVDDGWGFTLGPTSPAGHRVRVGDEVTAEIAPEGPQRDDLAEDVAAALAANPDAGAFFDSLAQFYRRAYLRWIDATKRRPEQRTERIAEMINLLRSGSKERP